MKIVSGYKETVKGMIRFKGGMEYIIKFYEYNGPYLILNSDAVTITYDVTNDDIKIMSDYFDLTEEEISMFIDLMVKIWVEKADKEIFEPSFGTVDGVTMYRIKSMKDELVLMYGNKLLGMISFKFLLRHYKLLETMVKNIYVTYLFRQAKIGTCLINAMVDYITRVYGDKSLMGENLEDEYHNVRIYGDQKMTEEMSSFMKKVKTKADFV